jgi:hypothetical protein
MGYYRNAAGRYYEGERMHLLDEEVPRRPDQHHTWDGEQWIAPDPAALKDARAQREVDAQDRLRFEIAFDIENRVRVLEGRQEITRATYRDALVARWKQLNPNGG